MSQPTRRTSWAPAATLAVVLAMTTACSGGDEPEPKTAGSPSATPAEVATAVSFGKMTGRLPAGARSALAKDVQKVVDGWLDAAYLGGDYPRTDFAGSWPGFTAGAQANARRDAALMSNQDIGAEIDGVEAERRVVRLDVLSAKKRPVGVTARVVLKFRTTGTTEQDVQVHARLFLTPGKDGWQVFGYDVRKDAA
jgi:hypothetical protein